MLPRKSSPEDDANDMAEAPAEQEMEEDNEDASSDSELDLKEKKESKLKEKKVKGCRELQDLLDGVPHSFDLERSHRVSSWRKCIRSPGHVNCHPDMAGIFQPSHPMTSLKERPTAVGTVNALGPTAPPEPSLRKTPPQSSPPPANSLPP